MPLSREHRNFVDDLVSDSHKKLQFQEKGLDAVRFG